MVGWPSAAQDRLPADVPRARHRRPGVPRRPLAVGRGGWGGFIPHAGRVSASGTPVASRWMQVWLVAAGERCVSSRATTSTGTPRRIRSAPDDHPYRARWHVSSLLHAADRAGADQGSDRRNAAVSVPVAWRPSPVRAGTSCTGSWTTRPWPDAGQRWRAPGLGSPTSATPAHAHMVGAWWAAARALPPHVPLVASEHNQMSWPGRRPRAAGPGRAAGRPVLRPRTVGPRPERTPGRRGSAWTTAGCATGARRCKACPPRRCRDSPRRG